MIHLLAWFGARGESVKCWRVWALRVPSVLTHQIDLKIQFSGYIHYVIIPEHQLVSIIKSLQ